MKIAASGLVAVLTLGTSMARAQSITTEVATSAGISSEEHVSAAGTQARAFGLVVPGVRYYVEAAWAGTTDRGSDAFGSAYPYANRVQMIEAYADGLFRPRSTILDVRGGRFRTPFGISASSDHAYTGFLRAPLLRYGGYWALSNTALEHGVDVVAGVPQLSLELSLGEPADVGAAPRKPGLDTVVRLQSLVGPFVIGASHLETQPDRTLRFATGSTMFNGVDVRWMWNGTQLRGEWLSGRPFNRASTTGWYVDAIVHRVRMGPVTAVARVEQLDYVTPSRLTMHSERQTVGARVRLREGLSVQMNLLHQRGTIAKYGPASVDVGVTYSLRPH